MFKGYKCVFTKLSDRALEEKVQCKNLTVVLGKGRKQERKKQVEVKNFKTQDISVLCGVSLGLNLVSMKNSSNDI